MRITCVVAGVGVGTAVGVGTTVGVAAGVSVGVGVGVTAGVGRGCYQCGIRRTHIRHPAVEQDNIPAARRSQMGYSAPFLASPRSVDDVDACARMLT